MYRLERGELCILSFFLLFVQLGCVVASVTLGNHFRKYTLVISENAKYDSFDSPGRSPTSFFSFVSAIISFISANWKSRSTYISTAGGKRVLTFHELRKFYSRR